MPESPNQKILYCVLNWGLGHASRSIPIIQKLSATHEVIVASDGIALKLLQKELSNVLFESLPSYDITYRYNNMAINILLQLPKISIAYLREHQVVKSLVKKYAITTIISDNRYGCLHSSTHNVFLGHQLNILTAKYTIHPFATWLNKQMISKFDEIWIPDNKDRLSGILSTVEWKIPNQLIGLQSRMATDQLGSKYLTILLSGPEPARTKLELQLIEFYSTTESTSITLIRGTNSPLSVKVPSTWEVYDLADSVLVSNILQHSHTVVCRSGYSTLMDLYPMDRFLKIILYPTAGQTEQEYLADLLSQKYAHIVKGE